MGKHRTKLYDKGNDGYSTLVGGMVTVVVALFLFSVSLSILVSCVNKEQWDSDVTSEVLTEWEHGGKTKAELAHMGLVFPILKQRIDPVLFVTIKDLFNGWHDARLVSEPKLMVWIDNDLDLLRDVIKRDYNIDLGPSLGLSGAYSRQLEANYTSYVTVVSLIDDY